MRRPVLRLADAMVRVGYAIAWATVGALAGFALVAAVDLVVFGGTS
jgi:hypothetical protein